MHPQRAWPILLIALLSALSAACDSSPQQRGTETDADPIAKIRVYQDGRITVNGIAVSASDLPSTLMTYKRRGGSVWYYRQRAEAEPNPNASAVLQAIVDAQLPISLSSQEDFSDVVLPDGTTRPR